jgi:NAD(P)-dependent dehydrogenase (short-subunit alcohol dehydrogenase family)
MNTNERLLVTGASGQLGQLVVEALLQAGQTHLIATTRQPEKLADFASRGVEVRTADFNQPETLVSAFAGATRLLLISTGDVGYPHHASAITNLFYFPRWWPLAVDERPNARFGNSGGFFTSYSPSDRHDSQGNFGDSRTLGRVYSHPIFGGTTLDDL